MTDSDEIQSIENDGDSHKYFHQMLNMADDDLDPYEYRLLGHYIRVGKCKQGLARIASITRMGKAKVIETRDRLEHKGYIANIKPTIEDARKGKTVHTTVIDRWSENIARYSKGGTNQNQPSTNQNHLPSTNQNRKKNSTKKNQEEENTPNGVADVKTPSYKEIVLSVWGQEKSGLSGHLISQLCGTAKKGRRADFRFDTPATPCEIQGFAEWFDDEYEDATLPTAAETLKERFDEFRGHPAYDAYCERHNGQAKPQVTEIPQETITPRTAEQQAEMDKIMGDLLRGTSV